MALDPMVGVDIMVGPSRGEAEWGSE